jgi:hypothetical protein
VPWSVGAVLPKRSQDDIRGNSVTNTFSGNKTGVAAGRPIPNQDWRNHGMAVVGKFGRDRHRSLTPTSRGCGHTTGGEPRFCNFCGRSYDMKLCPKLHVNPRLAEACSQCGTRDLSTPQPKVPLRWLVFAFLSRWLSAAVLFLLSLQLISRMIEDLRSISKVQESFLRSITWTNSPAMGTK